MRRFENILALNLSADIGLLTLRLSVALLMLFHGLAKIIHGIGGIKKGLSNFGLPEFLAYGVYVGEIVAPILLIVGLYTRCASLIISITMAFAIFIAYSDKLFLLNKFGAPIIETPLLFLLMGVVLMFTGAGKYSFDESRYNK